jgi:hypothetical protein
MEDSSSKGRRGKGIDVACPDLSFMTLFPELTCWEVLGEKKKKGSE